MTHDRRVARDNPVAVLGAIVVHQMLAMRRHEVPPGTIASGRPNNAVWVPDKYIQKISVLTQPKPSATDLGLDHASKCKMRR